LTLKSIDRRIKIGAPTPTFKVLNITVMISPNLVFVQLAQYDDYLCIRELAKLLEVPVSVVRHKLKDLGDRVEHNDRDEWRVVREIVIDDNLLSPVEKEERDNLERTVQQAFFIAGKALKQLRDKRLYRETHATFESYVRDRFDFTKRAAYYLIDAHEVMNNLKSEQFVHTNTGTNILPTKESQCRPLAKLPPSRQREIWRDAVEKANGKVPSARIIKEVVNQNSSHSCIKIKPEDRELIYKPGTGIDYVVHLDEETYRLLETYQDRIGTATKKGAIRRLLEDAIAAE
jgi:Fe-S cluster biosynthesis and repair protein YggX